MAMFFGHAPLKNARALLSRFRFTATEPQWQCALKSTPSFELVFELLDSPGRYHTAQADYNRLLIILQTFEISVTKIHDRIFNEGCVTYDPIIRKRCIASRI
jgi:hypothetical protein